MRYLTSSQISPIARMQQQHYGLGFLGLTGSESGAAKGASTGASIGSAVPVIGTAVGAILGAVGGAIAGSLGKKDPEQYNFDQAVAMWQQNPNLVYNIGNKYLPLAGLFDLNIKTNIPIYKRYGRMGEQKFVTDLVNQIYQAAQSGKITASDTPLTIMSRVVQPWIDSWGFGPMADPHADMINRLIIGMVADYVDGSWKNSWFARGGDFPFSSLPLFSLPAVAAPAQVTAPSATAQLVPVSQVAPVASQPTPVSTNAAGLAKITQVYSNDGASITAGLNGLGVALEDGQGNLFQLGPPQGQVASLWVNSAYTGKMVYSVSISGKQAYVKTSANGVTVPFASLSASSAPAVTAPPVSNTTVPIPAGYVVAGTDQATGLPIYGGANGQYYTWTGTTMTSYSGTANTASGLINFSNGAPIVASPAVTVPTQQVLPALPPGPTSYLPDTSASTAAPAASPPSTAGVTGAGLPSWLTWGAVAGVVALMFATAHPLHGGNTKRGSSRG